MELSLRIENMIESKKSIFQEILVIGTIIFFQVFLYAASARLAIYIPISPIPITCQTLVLFLISGVCGRQYSLFSIISYIGLGIIGFPMFVGVSGIQIINSPSFGYLIGMIGASVILGKMSSNRVSLNKYFSIASLVMATGVIYLIGIAWLGIFIGYNLELLVVGVAPFIIGDILKIIMAHLLIKPIKILIRKIIYL